MIQHRARMSRPQRVWAASSQTSAFVNKVLVRPGKTHLFIYMLSNCFCTTRTELSSCNGDHMAREPKIFTIWPLTEKKKKKNENTPAPWQRARSQGKEDFEQGGRWGSQGEEPMSRSAPLTGSETWTTSLGTSHRREASPSGCPALRHSLGPTPPSRCF